MRALLAVLLLTPSLALPEPTPPADLPAPNVAPALIAPASQINEERLFNSTEVFRLDPGTSRIELGFASGAPSTSRLEPSCSALQRRRDENGTCADGVTADASPSPLRLASLIA